MSEFDSKYLYFKSKQTEILKLSDEYRDQKALLEQEYRDQAADLQKEFNAKDEALHAPLLKAGETYKAELKAWCGVTDGERANILDLIGLIRRTSDL